MAPLKRGIRRLELLAEDPSAREYPPSRAGKPSRLHPHRRACCSLGLSYLKRAKSQFEPKVKSQKSKVNSFLWYNLPDSQSHSSTFPRSNDPPPPPPLHLPPLVAN